MEPKLKTKIALRFSKNSALKHHHDLTQIGLLNLFFETFVKNKIITTRGNFQLDRDRID